MNILIINGSPRKKGLISQMLDIMREEAENRGDKVQTVYTNALALEYLVQTITWCHPCYA
jgi:multimeric flavodoxin WrbA